MRGLDVAVLVGLLLPALAGCGDEQASAKPLTREQCLEEWSDAGAPYEEMANPGGLPALAERWDELHAKATPMNLWVRGRCNERKLALAPEWGGLTRLMFDLHDYDVLTLLKGHEHGRTYYIGNGFEVPPDVTAGLRQLRRAAPLAAADLDPVFAEAGDVDFADPDSRAEFMDRVREAAGQSEHFAEAQEGLEQIVSNVEWYEQ